MIYPFSGIGNSFTLAATTANQTQQMQASGQNPPTQKTIRVVNEAAAAALVSFGDATANALTDGKAMSVNAGGERIFSFPPTATYCAVALRSGTGNVQVQLGEGA